MNNPIFAATQRPGMIDRHEELKMIKEAILSPGDEPRLVIIEGEGGLGKTHLLREVLRQMGRPEAHYPAGSSTENWAADGRAIVSDLLDLADIHLYTFRDFIRALRNAFTWHRVANFSRFDRAEAFHRRKVYEQATYQTIELAAKEAELAFLEDYQTIARQSRLVWVLDTAERLSFISGGWLLEKNMLTPEDLSFSTQQRLLELLMEGELPNTTILLAGRHREAKIIFDTFKDNKNGAGSRYQVTPILLRNFSREDTRTYLVELAQNWLQQQPDSPVTAYLQDVANDPDRADVLWLYTGGQPVRLALYTDALAEGKKEPAALQDTFTEAKARVGWNEATNEPAETKLRQIQFEIEGEFINLIFAKAGELRSQILRVLAQAGRGLKARHLHFVLDAPSDLEGEPWEEDATRLKEIEAELDAMYYLSFVKNTPEGYTLQDEMYNIYDRHAVVDEATLQGEILSRQLLYRRLLILIDQEIDHLRRQKARYLEEDEEKLRWESPARALSMRFPYLSEIEVGVRINLGERLLQAQIEKLYYELRLDPYEALNNTFYDLAEEQRFSHIEGDVQLFNELRRVLSDEFAHHFVQLPSLEEAIEQQELWTGLERAAYQEEIVRWIKRFAFTEQHARAIEFTEQVESFVDTLPRENRGTLGWTLGHTFARGERTCWREFARITIGQDRAGAIHRLAATASELERLLTPAGIPERKEGNFLEHPAKIRLRRVIGAIYNNIGLAYTAQGQFRQSAQAYAEALHYFRETGFIGQRATTLNNLSRALSELGRQTRAIRICRDGLSLRQALGYEASIAYSYNTLALIYNNNLQPDDAWLEVTKAVVYFRRLADPRGLGLSLLQLGEALRRLALSPSPLVGSPEELLKVAEDASLEALDIFTNTPEVNRQIMRRIEAEIELGSLYRDYMLYVKSQLGYPEQEIRWRRFKDKALQHLDEAVRLAKEKIYPFHQLDAQVNLAWTLYYADDPVQAEAVYDQIMADLDGKPFVLRKDTPPPLPQEIDETYALFQLSRLWTVKGRIALDRFLGRVQEIQSINRDETKGHQAARLDPQVNQHIQTAAEAFVLSLAYALLFSPRAPNIGISFDNLYEYLKIFNNDEMELFYKYQHEARQHYRISEIKPENLADVEEFLLESFGDYLPKEVKKR